MLSYDFPGNVREMINMVHNTVTVNSPGTLDLADFPGLTPGNATRRDLVRKIGSNQFALYGIFHGFPTVDAVQTMLVEEAFKLAQGNRSIAAKMLGVSRPTLQKRLEQVAGKRPDDEVE